MRRQRQLVWKAYAFSVSLVKRKIIDYILTGILWRQQRHMRCECFICLRTSAIVAHNSIPMLWKYRKNTLSILSMFLAMCYICEYSTLSILALLARWWRGRANLYMDRPFLNFISKSCFHCMQWGSKRSPHIECSLSSRHCTLPTLEYIHLYVGVQEHWVPYCFNNAELRNAIEGQNMPEPAHCHYRRHPQPGEIKIGGMGSNKKRMSKMQRTLCARNKGYENVRLESCFSLSFHMCRTADQYGGVNAKYFVHITFVRFSQL